MGLEDKAKEKEIDGVTYSSWPVPTSTGIPALKRTIDIISPLMVGYGEGKEMGLFAALPTALSDKDIEYYQKTFGNASKYRDGQNWVPLVYQNQDLHFAGRYMALLQWIVFNMEVNFSGFFSGTMSGGGIADLVTMMQAKKAS